MSNSYQRLLADLRRRNVFRVATVYGATGFVVLQVADLLASSMELPSVVMRITTFLILVGFPIALVLAWALESSPEGIKRTTPAEAGELEAIIAEPASRRWPAGILALGGVFALIAGVWWVGRASAPLETPSEGAPVPAASVQSTGSQEILRVAYADLAEDRRPSIAVLPFVDLSPTQDQEYFTDGMTEEILNALAKIRALRVSGRTSSFAYRGQERNLREIGAELGVQYLVEGSLRQQGAQRRITAQLIDAAGDFHIWSDTYDYSVDDVFRIQSEIAESVARELEVSLGLGGGGNLVTPTSNPEAYDLFLRGRAAMGERGDGVSESVALFTRATALDPGWPPAWAALANAQTLLPHYPPQGATGPDSAGWSSALEAAEAAAQRALALDPRNAAAEVALGSVFRDGWDWEQSEVHFLRALAIDPDDPNVHHQYSDMLAAMGRTPEAVRSARRAIELDPTSVIRLNWLCSILLVDNSIDEAKEVCTRAVALQPRIPHPYYHLSQINLIQGDLEGAVEAHWGWYLRPRTGQPQPGDSRFAELEAFTERWKAAWRNRDVAALGDSGDDAWIGPMEWLALGDTARALTMMEERLRDLPYRTDDVKDLWRILPLPEARGDPRFTYVIERLGLAR
jgi:TolB-like protein/tetratricopeptide (TPR) repeat protein